MGVKDLFELHIYTMGSRSYARKVWERRSLAVTCVLCCVRTSVLMRSILRRPTLPLGTQVAQIIDPEQKLFRENIVSRDECGSTWNATQHSALHMFQG
jgi:TFIIF-interacting CTD phosphatase-like protein